MKKILGSVLLVLGIVGPAFASDVAATSRISQVTVYASSAFVTRSATVAMKSGDSRVVFAGIVPEIDENSLRVKGKGSAEVRLLGAQLMREYTADVPAEKVRQLTDEIQALEDQDAKLENEKLVLDNERNIIKKLYREVVRFADGRPITDDIAILLCEFTGGKDRVSGVGKKQ